MSRRDPEVQILIGGVDVAPWAQHITVRSSVNEMSSAQFDLQSADLPADLDWQGEVRVTATKPVKRAMFTGVILEASLTGRGLFHVECRGSGVVLEEATTGRLVLAVPGVDAIHWLLRSSDWPDSRMKLDGIDDELPREVFEVICPVAGVSVQRPVQIGNVTLVGSSGLALPTGDADHEELIEELVAPGTVALVNIDAARSFDAMADGVEQIDVALAWLESRAHDGAAVRGGKPWDFKRSRTRTTPRRGPTVLVRGCSTGRFILHSSSIQRDGGAIDLAPFASWAMPPFNANLHRSDQLAILAWARACQGAVTEQRVQALWDAMEYYASSTQVPHMYGKETLDLLIAAASSVELTTQQRDRVRSALGQLNAPPLMVRLKTAASVDGVPLSKAQLEVLGRLRRARNRASHGQQTDALKTEDLRQGLSIVARLLGARMTCPRSGQTELHI